MIIVSESQRRNRLNGLVPTLSLYSGVYFKVLAKCRREGYLENSDVFVLTKRGLLGSNDLTTYDEPIPGAPGSLRLTGEEIERSRRKNLRMLKQAFASKRYGRVYVNVGREYIALLGGIEKVSPVSIEYAMGRGLGPKAQHMREWIHANA